VQFADVVGDFLNFLGRVAILHDGTLQILDDGREYVRQSEHFGALRQSQRKQFSPTTLNQFYLSPWTEKCSTKSPSDGVKNMENITITFELGTQQWSAPSAEIKIAVLKHSHSCSVH
jgi:hypothetical protein